MRLSGRTFFLAVLAYLTVMTWPLPIARAVLAIAFRPRTYGVTEAIEVVGPFAGVGAAVTVAVLCRR
ncbi:MAG: hypothetical protein ACRENE_07080, partial [Polyangiaceae bacterium]